ncbi:hypothetical protein EIN_137470, partial [Entamoeba invadens IP1]
MKDVYGDVVTTGCKLENLSVNGTYTGKTLIVDNEKLSNLECNTNSVAMIINGLTNKNTFQCNLDLKKNDFSVIEEQRNSSTEKVIFFVSKNKEIGRVSFLESFIYRNNTLQIREIASNFDGTIFNLEKLEIIGKQNLEKNLSVKCGDVKEVFVMIGNYSNFVCGNIENLEISEAKVEVLKGGKILKVSKDTWKNVGKLEAEVEMKEKKKEK